MEKQDARKESRELLQSRRAMVVRLHQDGVPIMQIVAQSGLSWAGVNAAIQKFKSGGESALMPAARGRKPGTGRTLTSEQEAAMRDFIRSRRPWFYRLKDSLWSRDTVQRLLDLKFGVRLSDRVMTNYLKRWGIYLTAAAKRPYERCSGDVQKWLDVNYSQIQRQADEEGAEIYWLNRPTALDPVQWSKFKSSDSKKSMVSVVNNQGRMLWVIIDGTFDINRQVNFVSGLIHSCLKGKIIIVRYDLRIFGSKKFRARIVNYREKVLIYPFGN